MTEPLRGPLRLNPRYVMRRLGRRLEGSYDPAHPTGDYALLHLVNTDQTSKVHEILADPKLLPGVGQDLIDFTAAYYEKAHSESDDEVRYQIRVPKAVWHRYAKRAREEHRKIRTLLTEAVIAHDERIQEAKEGQASTARQLEILLKQQRETQARLAKQVEQLGEKPSAAALPKGVSELLQHAVRQGTALAALLMIMNSQGWIDDRLSAQLKRDKWI